MLKRLLTMAAGLSLGLLAAGCNQNTAQNAASQDQGAAPAATNQAAVDAATPDMKMFDGKTITYIVSTGPGGGYDEYGRLIARYMQKYLPGSRILVRNVPGAGHIIGANTIYAADADGTTIGTFNTGLIYDQLLERKGVRFDLTKFSYIGKASSDQRAVVISTSSPYKSFDDMMHAKQPVKFAASGIGSAAYIETRILKEALHLNAQIVPGFTGNEGEMSMLRHEVVAEVGTATSMENFIQNGHGFVALSLSQSHPVPGVPSAEKYATDPQAKRLLALISTLSDIGRLTAGPPGMPPKTLATLRAAYNKAVADPGLMADAMKLDLPLDPASGDVVEQRIKKALMQPPETVTFLKEAAGT